MKNNINWRIEDIAYQYKIENLDWSWKKCYEKAKIIYRELKKINNDMWQNNKVFFRQNIPFSSFNNRDDEFSNIFFDKDDSEY